MAAPTVTPETGANRYVELSTQLDKVCRSAVDTDEMAAYLEASGLNDRITAREFGDENVFALAARMRADRDGGPAEPPPAVPSTSPIIASWLVATLVRSALYLTPAVLAVGGAQALSGLPRIAGPGALIYAWAAAQALSFLGYRALGAAGPVRAARLLGAGFVVVALAWAGVLAAFGVTDLRAQAVAAGQLALFAATAVALITGAERRVLGAATLVWGAAAGVAFTGRLWLVAPALVVLVLVAYRPAFGRARRFRLRPADGGAALAHGTVGAGQAVLFALVVLAGADQARIPTASIPLLVGVPLAELVLAWHQRRVAASRAVLTDRGAYRAHLTRVATGTIATLTLPVLVGAGLATAGFVLGLPGIGRLAAAVLLTAVYAQCLVLVAHHRLGVGALLVWWPAVLIGLLYHTVPAVAPGLVPTLVAIVLFAVCLPALGVVFMVLRDRWSYR